MAVGRTAARLGALLLGALAGCGADPGSDQPPIRVARIVRDFLAEPDAWRPQGASGGVPARVETICPALQSGVDGADMPSLVVPPPGAVTLEVPADAVPCRLMARVGVDQSSFRAVSAEDPALEVRFELAFDLQGATRSPVSESVSIRHGAHGENVWRDLGGAEGIALVSAGTLTLRTSVHRPDGTPVEPPPEILAGFGGLRLERAYERARTRSAPETPNVILVVMDTLRADRLACYGSGRPTSPHLDVLAQRGTLFEQAYSVSSWTWPATASLLTGLTPMEHGLVNEGSSFLLEAAETLAEGFQQAGLTTAAWSANPIVSEQRNFDQGFEQFHSPSERFQKTQELFDGVRAFLRAQQGTRFFLYLHLADPHTPLRPLDEGLRLLAPDLPPGFAERSDGFWHATAKGQGVRAEGLGELDSLVSPEDRAHTRALYDASVWSGDHWLGELLAELEALGLADETLVAFTADHGEELFDRGILGHGQSLRRELVHVPLVVAGPGVPAGQRSQANVSTRAVAPLLARLAGVPFTGAAQAGRLLDGADGDGPVLFTTTKGFWKGRNGRRLVGLVEGRWKIDVALNGAPWGSAEIPAEGDLELFDLAQDPLERTDQSAMQPAEARRLRALLLEQMEALEERRIGTAIPAAGVSLRVLEQLGYL